jgi:hypothetical protein
MTTTTTTTTSTTSNPNSVILNQLELNTLNSWTGSKKNAIIIKGD